MRNNIPVISSGRDIFGFKNTCDGNHTKRSCFLKLIDTVGTSLPGLLACASKCGNVKALYVTFSDLGCVCQDAVLCFIRGAVSAVHSIAVHLYNKNTGA